MRQQVTTKSTQVSLGSKSACEERGEKDEEREEDDETENDDEPEKDHSSRPAAGHIM